VTTLAHAQPIVIEYLQVCTKHLANLCVSKRSSYATISASAIPASSGCL